MKKILIIEDDQIVANVYRNKLAVEGYQTEAAPDGESGLKLMRTFRPDAIVLDLMLPKLDGLSLIQQISGSSSTTRIFLVAVRFMKDSSLPGPLYSCKSHTNGIPDM